MEKELMKRLAGLLAIGIIAAGFATATVSVASAGPNDKVDLQQDCGVPCVEAVDSTGPTGFGFTNYNVDGQGNLRVVASLKNAAPNTTYHIFLVCGPTHDTSCGFTDIGTLTTNGQGNGNSGAIILAGNPYGGGVDDHVDLLKGVGDQSAGTYISTPIVH
jgi:hypothetical protein